MSDDVTRKVIAIIAQHARLEPERLTPDSTLAALGIDSLGIVEMMFDIEEAFDISVPYNANEAARSDFDISTVAKIVEAVKRLVAEQA